jgi:hypothetical protein
MNENIHRINNIIKMSPGLKYDASTGLFETDRKALYDFAVMVVQVCANQADKGGVDPGGYIREYFGVEE